MPRPKTKDQRPEIFSYEGLQGGIRDLKTPKIDVWRNQYPVSRSWDKCR